MQIYLWLCRQQQAHKKGVFILGLLTVNSDGISQQSLGVFSSISEEYVDINAVTERSEDVQYIFWRIYNLLGQRSISMLTDSLAQIMQGTRRGQPIVGQRRYLLHKCVPPLEYRWSG